MGSDARTETDFVPQQQPHCALRPAALYEHSALVLGLDSMTFKVFSNLSDSVTIRRCQGSG